MPVMRFLPLGLLAVLGAAAVVADGQTASLGYCSSNVTATFPGGQSSSVDFSDAASAELIGSPLPDVVLALRTAHLVGI